MFTAKTCVRHIVLFCLLILSFGVIATDYPAPSSLDYQQNFSLASQQTHTHSFVMPEQHAGWRLVFQANQQLLLELRNITTNQQVFLQQQRNRTIFFLPEQLQAGDEYRLTVQNSASTTATYTLASEASVAHELPWDLGSEQPEANSVSAPVSSTGFTGGDWLFKVKKPLYSLHGLSRVVLTQTGDLQDVDVSIYIGDLTAVVASSQQRGNVVLHLTDDQLPSASDIYIKVSPRSFSANWSLFAGDIFVQDLGNIVSDYAANTIKTVGPEGMVFFKAFADASVPAWQLYLSPEGGASTQHSLAVRKNFPAINGRFFDLAYLQQMLLVPDYLTTGSYYIGISAEQGTVLNLKSKIQPIASLSFTGMLQDIAVSADEFAYKTYRVQVPVDQIAWQTQLVSLQGNANLYVRSDKVPNEFNNEGFSEAAAQFIDSVTHVPPILVSTSWYVTVRGQGAYRFNLSSGNPVVTDIAFVNDPVPVVNGEAFNTLAGWRYYRVSDIQSQLGNLGWELKLAKHNSGSRIAVRRNAVPSGWQYRQNNNPYIYNSEVLAASSASGLLQLPNHQADVWYVGIYNERSLGDFELNTFTSQPPALAFNAGQIEVTDQSPQNWRYFSVVVPEGVDGWSLRLTHISGGHAGFVVSKDELPDTRLFTDIGCSYPLYSCATWQSGLQLAANSGWAARYFNADGLSQFLGQELVLGMGAPLSAGTYFVGVTGISASESLALNYRIESKGIGSFCGLEQCALQVTELALGQTITAEIAEPRSAAYYKTAVPTGLTGFNISMVPTVGEAAMGVRFGTLPNSYMSYTPSDSNFMQGSLRDSLGAEYFYKLHEAVWNSQTQTIENTLRAGNYYAVVISQGQSAVHNAAIGTGSVGYTLTANALAVLDKTDTPLQNNQTISWDNQLLQKGQIQAYRVRVPAGISNMEVRLTLQSGDGRMILRRDPIGQGALPFVDNNFNGNFTVEGGIFSTSVHPRLITVTDPDGDYTVIVQGATDNSRYTIDFVAQGEAQLGFNDGLVAVTEQAPLTWRYFKVEVPQNADGWELVLDGISGGTPTFVVSKDTLPTSLNTTSVSCLNNFYPAYLCRHWVAGAQVGPYDWTFRSYSDDGITIDNSKRLVLGMGSPLEPGTYWVGVTAQNASVNQSFSYTLYSRGIGVLCGAEPCTLPVKEVPFSGSIDGVIGNARDAAFYRIQVPENEAGWQLTLELAEGHEAALAVQYGALPNSYLSSQTTDGLWASGVGRNKRGGEFLYKLQQEVWDNQTGVPSAFLRAGAYYVAVVSQGQLPPNSYSVGSGAVSFNLKSSPVMVADLTGAPLQNNSSKQWLNQHVAEGEVKFYRVRVRDALSNMEVRVSNLQGLVSLVSRGDAEGEAKLVSPAMNRFNYRSAEGGYAPKDTGALSQTITAPEGDYTFAVYGGADSFFDFEVVAKGEEPLNFNDGSIQVLAQPADGWRFFKVEVPENAEGWQVKLRHLGGELANFVIRKDSLPDMAFSFSYCRNNTSRFLNACNTWGEDDFLVVSENAWSYISTYTDGTPIKDRQVVLGMNNPLTPGTYYIGVTGAPSNSAAGQLTGVGELSYQLQSFGVGEQCGAQRCTIAVTPLALGESISADISEPNEARFYKVNVPEGTKNWQVSVTPQLGDVMLGVLHNALPNSYLSGSQTDFGIYSGVRRDKAGAEYFYKFGEDRWQSDSQQVSYELSSGNYYLAVVSQGQQPVQNSQMGLGPVRFTLSNSVFTAKQKDDETLLLNSPILWQGEQLNFGEAKAYRVALPEDALSIEMRLLNKTGNPVLAVIMHDEEDKIPQEPHSGLGLSYTAAEGGISTSLSHQDIVTVSRLARYATVLVKSHPLADATQQQVGANYDLQFSVMAARDLGFDGGEYRQQNLANNQQHLYRVVVPDLQQNGIAGWQLDTEVIAGNVSVRATKNHPPASETAYWPASSNQRQTVLTAPFLTPGVWYVEVLAQGISEYHIRSSAVAAKAHWLLPTSESASVLAGASGVVDLEQTRMDFYKIEVPQGNNGLIRAELIKISGEADMYLRYGDVPTLSHNAVGSAGQLLDRANNLNNSQYANWVVLDARNGFYDNQIQLKPGIWWLGVKARQSNARYELTVSNGNVQTLPIANGRLTNQLLAAGDMRHYKVEVPDSALTLANSTPDWLFNLQQQSGDVVLFVRESLPAGQVQYVLPPQSVSSGYFVSWRNDNNFDARLVDIVEEGEHRIGLDIVKPGKTYYLSVFAKTDAVFEISTRIGTERLQLDAELSVLQGDASLTLPPNSERLIKVKVPANTEFYRHELVASSAVAMYLERDRVPTASVNHLSMMGSHNAEYRLINRDLSFNYFPWQPVGDFYVLLKNTGSQTEEIRFSTLGNSYEPDVTGPVFPELPVLNFEATGPLTPYTPGAVYTTDDYDGTILATTSFAGPLAVGEYVIEWSATDTSGNTSVAQQLLYILDTTAPVVTAPADVQAEATGQETTVALGTASATDIVSGELTAVTEDIGPFALGRHLVTWRATDTAGNVGVAYQYVVIVDTTAPSISGAANVNVSTKSNSGVSASHPAIAKMLAAVSASDLVDGVVSVTANYPATFPIGNTQVTFSASDNQGNSSSVTVSITVVFDDEAPLLTLPEALTLYVATETTLSKADPRIRAFLAKARAVDKVDGTLQVSNNAPEQFNVGTTIVRFSALDSAGNLAVGDVGLTIIVDPEKAKRKKRRSPILLIIGAIATEKN